MAYDLVVGKSAKIKDAPHIVGSIEFSELVTINKLRKYVDSYFLDKMSNLFEDASFSVAEVKQAIIKINPLMSLDLNADEKIMLHKLLAVLGYAHQLQLPLFGVAD